MTGIVHTFVSGKTDVTDASLVRPSNWNADHQITGTIGPTVDDGGALGTIAACFSDLFLADGGVVSFGNVGSRATITHIVASDSLTIHADPDNATASSVINFAIDSVIETTQDGTAFYPAANDANALGTSTLKWADLFLASGGVINWNSSDITLAHSAGPLLTATGGAFRVTFGSQIFHVSAGSSAMGMTQAVNNNAILITDTDPIASQATAFNLQIGFNSSGAFATADFTAIHQGTAYIPLRLQPTGGETIVSAGGGKGLQIGAPTGGDKGTGTLSCQGDIYVAGSTYMIRSTGAWTNNAAASGGTLTNAPAAGNPTKWIRIDDAGTARFIPAW